MVHHVTALKPAASAFATTFAENAKKVVEHWYFLPRLCPYHVEQKSAAGQARGASNPHSARAGSTTIRGQDGNAGCAPSGA